MDEIDDNNDDKKGCGTYLKGWLILSVILSLTFLALHGCNLLWIRLTLECDFWCQINKVGAVSRDFANQNPVLAIILIAVIISGMLVVIAAAPTEEDRKTTEKAKTGDKSGEIPTVGREDPPSPSIESEPSEATHETSRL